MSPFESEDQKQELLRRLSLAEVTRHNARRYVQTVAAVFDLAPDTPYQEVYDVVYVRWEELLNVSCATQNIEDERATVQMANICNLLKETKFVFQDRLPKTNDSLSNAALAVS